MSAAWDQSTRLTTRHLRKSASTSRPGSPIHGEPSGIHSTSRSSVVKTGSAGRPSDVWVEALDSGTLGLDSCCLVLRRYEEHDSVAPFVREGSQVFLVSHQCAALTGE